MSFKHCPDLRTFSFTMAPDDSGWRVRVLTGEHSREGGREEGREGEPVYTEGTRHAEVDDCLRDKKAVFKKKKERGSVGCFRDGVVSSGSEGGGGERILRSAQLCAQSGSSDYPQYTDLWTW